MWEASHRARVIRLLTEDFGCTPSSWPQLLCRELCREPPLHIPSDHHHHKTHRFYSVLTPRSGFQQRVELHCRSAYTLSGLRQFLSLKDKKELCRKRLTTAASSEESESLSQQVLMYSPEPEARPKPWLTRPTRQRSSEAACDGSMNRLLIRDHVIADWRYSSAHRCREADPACAPSAQSLMPGRGSSHRRPSPRRAHDLSA